MKKLLIIRFSSIGDIVLTTPVVRCLKTQMPGIEIHYLTKKQFAPVIETNPYIDRIITIRDKISEILPMLKKENYDHIFDLHKNFRSRSVIFHSGKPYTSFNKINFEKWLIVNLKINRLPSLHIVDRYFIALRKFGVNNDNMGLDYFIPAEDEVNPASLPQTHRDGYIGWVIGGKHRTKIYPEEKIAEVCRKSDRPVILLGGPEDAERGEHIRITAGKHVYNACGKYNLNQSASLVKQAEMIITNDTGLMHIAAAFKKEIISVWGNTIPGFGMSPYMPGYEQNSIIMEVNNLKCRPCSKLGFNQCPKKHFDCMNQINVEVLCELINGKKRPEA